MNRRHGMTLTPEYRTWRGMKQRCLNPKATQFSYYGGRGVTVCNRWRDSFEAFLADVGPRPNGMTLDRFPNAGGNYEPGNVRWANQVQQVTNSRAVHRITHDGIADTIAGWSRRVGLPAKLIALRLHRGWDVSRAITRRP